MGIKKRGNQENQIICGLKYINMSVSNKKQGRSIELPFIHGLP
jgi:hypothetical protein